MKGSRGRSARSGLPGGLRPAPAWGLVTRFGQNEMCEATPSSGGLSQGEPPSPLEGPEFSLDFLRLHPEGSSYLRDEAIELKRIGSQG